MIATALRRQLLALVVLACFLPFLFLKGDDIFTMLDAVAVSVGIGVIIAYLPGYWKWLWARHTTAGFLLALGILATWIAAVGRLAWLWLWRFQDRGEEFFDHPFVAFTIYLFILGGSLHLLANSAIEGEEGDAGIPVYGWAILGSAISVGAILGVTLILWT